MPFNLKGSVDGNALKKTTFKVTTKGKGGKGKLERLSQLPKSWWKTVDKDYKTYNYRTRTQLAGIPVETLLDGGAGVSSCPEEVVVGCINVAEAAGISVDDERYPVVQLEKMG